jgi:N-acetylmuramoyl-L-alanine amidase
VSILRARAVVAAALITAACAPFGTRRDVPAPWARATPALPPVPFRDGPLALSLVYPPENGEVTVRDTTFVFGSAGTGRAELTINGTPVAVAPNGAFLAFLPVPRDGVYRLEAAAGEQRRDLIRHVRVPTTPPSPQPGEAAIIPRSLFPRGQWAAMPGEPIEVGLRGTAGGDASLVLEDGSRIPLVERGPVADVPWGRRVFGTLPPVPEPAVPGLAEYRGAFAARPISASSVEVNVGGHVTRVPLPFTLAVVDPGQPRVGIVHEPEPFPRSAGGVYAATNPGSTSHYFWGNGTELTLTGERDGQFRVRLAPEVSAWLPRDRVRLLPQGTPTPRGRVGTVRLAPAPEAVDVRIELDRRLPYRVDSRERALDITIYGAAGNTRWLMSGGLDRHVVAARWSQPGDGVYVLTLELAAPHWGHAVSWDTNGDLVVRVRRPPAITRYRPLRGLIVAVDAGHPPGGATGPTGLTEAEVNLAVARRLAQQLERAGARAVLTRSDERPLGLYERVQIAEAAGAHLFVSVHQNALPDGVDPFASNGTSTFHFDTHGEALARTLQAELLREFGLRDLGVGRSSFAVLRRLTWMPAVLTETMFMMVPEQEAALGDPDVRERVARAHLRAIERFLRERARAR